MYGTYFKTSFDREKASISLPEDAFENMKQKIKHLEYQFTLNKCHLSDYQESFITEVSSELDVIEEQEDAPYEIWMDYSILEEMHLLVSDSDATVNAEFQDSLREFERLREEE